MGPGPTRKMANGLDAGRRIQKVFYSLKRATGPILGIFRKTQEISQGNNSLGMI